MAAPRALKSAMRTIVEGGGESAQIFLPVRGVERPGSARKWLREALVAGVAHAVQVQQPAVSRVKLGLIPACRCGAKCTVCLLLHETQTTAHEVAQGLSARSFAAFENPQQSPATPVGPPPGLGCNGNPPTAIPGAGRPAGAVVRHSDATTSGPDRKSTRL